MCFLATSAVAFGQSPNPIPTDSPGRSFRPVEEQARHVDGPNATDAPDAPQPNEPQNTVLNLPKAILHDQFGMWTSPTRLRFTDATWLVPLGGFTAALLATDTDVS